MIKYKEHNKMKQAEKSNRPSLKNSLNRKIRCRTKYKSMRINF